MKDIKEENEFLEALKGELRNQFNIPITFHYGQNRPGLAIYDSGNHTIEYHPYVTLTQYNSATFRESYKNISYDELGCYVLFHEIGHSQDQYRKQYTGKQRTAENQQKYKLFANLELCCELTAYRLGNDCIDKFVKTDYYKLLSNGMDLELERAFFHEFNLLNLKGVAKDLKAKYPSLASSNWFNKIEEIMNGNDKPEKILSKLSKKIYFNRTRF